MKLDIPYYIRQVLREQRMVNIPGIGILRLLQTKATFNDDKKTLNPPSLSIEFDENSTEDDSLLKYILDTGELSETKAKKKIEQYNQAAFNKVLNVDAFKIEGIGVLSKKAGEDSITFTPSVSELTQEYQNLTPIQTTPITRLDENSTYKDYTAPLIAPPRKESDSYFPRIILFVALILAAFFIWKYLYDHYSNDKTVGDNTEIVDDFENNKLLAIADSSEEDLKQKYAEIDDLIDPNKSNEKSGTESNKIKSEDISKETSPVKKDPPVVTNEANTSSEKDGTTLSLGTPSLNKHADIIPESGECIIIVGSFMKTINAIKMTSLLERKGYKAFKSVYKGYTRVGFKYSCGNEDLEEYLQEVRKTISKKAWYLDPDLEVAYSK